MGAAVTAALALGRALRIALFGVWLVQPSMRFGFLRLFLNSHGSRPGRRYALWQGASEAWAVPVSISVKVLRSHLRVHCEIEDTRSTDTACEVISGAPVADKMTAANGRTPKKGPQNCGSFLSFQVQLLSQARWRATTAANATIPAFLLSLRPAGRPGVRASVDTHARSGRRPLEVSFPPSRVRRQPVRSHTWLPRPTT